MSQSNSLTSDNAGKAAVLPDKSALQGVRSPLRYPGGKQKAVAQIKTMLPRRIEEYREPMVGGASVYLQARRQGLAKKYWINDKYDDLIHFWQAVQNKRTCLKLVTDLERLHRSFTSVEDIKRFFLRNRDKEVTDPYEIALLFFFFNRVTFSGTTRAGGFSNAAAQRRFTLSSIKRLLPMPVALENTRITQVDVADLITEPGDGVFLFLDPPYFTANRLYGRNGGLHAFDHEKLASLLKRSPHRFLVTYDDCPEIRKLYDWATIKKWKLQYGMNNCNAERESKIGSELFILNY